MSKYRLTTKKPATLTLLVMISFGSIGAILFTPGLPAITHFFHVSNSAAQWTVTIFLIGYALGQLVYGPITNRFGRKKALYIGISISILGYLLSALSAPAHSFNLLLIARFISALGASVGLTLTFTIISDFYFSHQARKIVPYTTLSFAIIPYLAIALGGFIVTRLNWESCFYFLTFYSVFAFILCLMLPETSTQLDPHAIKFFSIIKKMIASLKNKTLVTHAAMCGASTAIIYIFNATAPLIVIKTMHVSPSIYGLFSLINSVGLVIGNILAVKFSEQYSERRVILIVIIISMLGTSILLLFSLLGAVNIYILFFSLLISLVGTPLYYSNAITIATESMEDKSSASSMLSFINMSSAVVGLFLISALGGPFIKTMPILFFATSIYLCGLFAISLKHS